MKTFEEIKEVKIDSIDRAAFAKLGRSRDFTRLRRIVEDYVQQLTYNLAAGTPTDRETRYAELDKVAGFTYFWRKITDLIDNSEHHKEKDENV